MKLKIYLTENGLSCKQFAAMVGLSEKSGNMAVWRWITENATYRQRPRMKMIQKIASITDGQVTANDFMD